jgi:hypothetical protein
MVRKVLTLGGYPVEATLRNEASQLNVDPDRLIFTPFFPYQVHFQVWQEVTPGKECVPPVAGCAAF